MPTNHDETLHERYAREHQAELASFARMTPEQISEMTTELHNALAERDAALAELAALKGGQEAVAWKVIGTHTKHRHPHTAVEFSEAIAEWRAAHWRNRGCTAEIIPLYTAPPAQASAWVAVSERLPESGRTVLAYYLNSHGKGRRIRAQYIKAWTVESECVSDPDTECVEYSEQMDTYYLLEGWYECIDNWDDYTRIAVNEGPISHWQPLPAAPTPGASE